MTAGNNYDVNIEMKIPRIDIIHVSAVSKRVYDQSVFYSQKVLLCAREYPTVFPIQMAATACLFNLSKPDLGAKIHPKILKEIVRSMYIVTRD